MSSCAARNYSSESLQDWLLEFDAPIILDAASSLEPWVDQVLFWLAFASASETAVVPGLLAERGVVQAQVRSADRVQLVATEAAQGQVQLVGQVQWADQARMEVS